MREAIWKTAKLLKSLALPRGISLERARTAVSEDWSRRTSADRDDRPRPASSRRVRSRTPRHACRRGERRSTLCGPAVARSRPDSSAPVSLSSVPRQPPGTLRSSPPSHRRAGAAPHSGYCCSSDDGRNLRYDCQFSVASNGAMRTIAYRMRTLTCRGIFEGILR